MADNYLGRQSRTGGGPIQVPDFKFLTRGQHAGSTVWLHVSHAFESQRLTNSGRNQKHKFKLCSEADCTICSAKHIDTDLTAAQTQQRRGAMLVGMDVILPLVRHHALTCQFKTSKQIDSIGLF